MSHKLLEKIDIPSIIKGNDFPLLRLESVKRLVKRFEPLAVLPDSPQDFPQHCGRFHFWERDSKDCYEDKRRRIPEPTG